MKPLVGVIHELPLPKVLEIAHLMNHTQTQQRPYSLSPTLYPLPPIPYPLPSTLYPLPNIDYLAKFGHTHN